MSIKTIALGLFSAHEASWLIPLACEVARSHGAHLTGVHPAQAVIPYSAMGAPYGPLFEPTLLDWQLEESAAIRTSFEAATRGESFGAEFRSQGPGAISAREWLLETLRAADLVVLGRADPAAMRPEDKWAQEAAIRHGGRPVLMLPEGRGLPAPVRRLMIGWSPTREATRAAHDALALAAPGATIDLLRVHNHATPSALALDSRHDLAAALDRQGYAVSLVDREAPAGETAKTLLSAALETEAELVATGAYGHSRTYDFVVGAVTRHLVEGATLPVLLSK
ncbi:universal stress protein [Pseudoroseicyclus tamaricis]|uniref:Universal stress protein n=1 Tax=Pseudoroseicyclus tamaricis TaxID=2705421 RepID=A0A6B2JMI2_9RHOB|nr:universal stress protein [Pseudoroseicyclus tamaricis]NDU99866.1 universal stress protein [Pseudoroseicyclus tamaricis]